MNLEELEKRISILEDIEEIKKLQARYINCLTTADWDNLLDCFTEDAVIDIKTKTRGKKELTKLFKEVISKNHVGLEGNFLVQPIISVEGDKAKGNWLFYVQFAQPRKLARKIDEIYYSNDEAPDWMQGYYDMEYSRIDGKWKICFLKWKCRLWSPRTSNKRLKDK
jgi:hypothetical protein